MLLTLVNTKKYGKFILHKFPTEIFPIIDKKHSPTQFTQSFTNYYSYFGMFHEKFVVDTSDGALSQTLLTQMFSANEKHTEVTVGIDDDCVFLCRSTFIKDHQSKIDMNAKSVSQQIEAFQNSVGKFTIIKNDEQSKLYSVSVAWCGKSFEEVQEIKHQLSFLLGTLQERQQNQLYLSAEIDKIMEKKQILKKKIKEKCQQFCKDEQCLKNEQKIQQFLKEANQLAKQQYEEIEVFKFLQGFHECIIEKKEFQVPNMQGTIGSEMKIKTELQFEMQNEIEKYKKNGKQQSTKKQEDLLNKTILTFQKKLQEILPSKHYKDQIRLKNIYDLALKNDNRSIKQILKAEKGELYKDSLLYSLKFLIQNELAISVYPFEKQSRFYNYYTLYEMPSFSQSDKFKLKVPQDNILTFIHNFNKMKKIKELDERIKYLILQRILSQVRIFIHFNENHRGNLYSLREQDKMLEGIANKYANKSIDLNEIICRQEQLRVSRLIEFINRDSNEKLWGFYYVEKK